MNFKNKILILTLFLVLLCSIGAISAVSDESGDNVLSEIDDNSISVSNDENAVGVVNQNSALNAEDETILSTDSSVGSFSDLNKSISGSSNKLILDKDYVFNSESDADFADTGVSLRGPFTLDGNGHSIDGNNSARLITMVGNDITVKNIIFKNSNITAVSLSMNRNVSFDNVTFQSCYSPSKGAAIIIGVSWDVIINNSKFISNDCESVSDIQVNMAKVTLTNSTFEGGNKSKWGHIYSYSGTLDFNNCTFLNSNSSYSSAFYAEGQTIDVVNCKFINLNASQTGGAIAVKGNTTLRVIGCNFTDTFALKNGGAIFADVLVEGESDLIVKTSIINSTFSSTVSEFGGAVMQLGGILNIVNSTFVNNSGFLNGASVWTSHADVNIVNSSFKDNSNSFSDLIEGGILYLDKGNILIKNSTFTDNNGAGEGGAVYTYDSNLTLIGNEFINNYNAVYSVFGMTNIAGDNKFNNDTVSLNNTFYSLIRSGDSIEIVLVNNTIDVVNLPSRFNLNDFGWVSPVKNQGNMGACWTFGACSALESALLKSTGVLYDFAENNVQNTMLQYSIFGIEGQSEGANSILMGTSYFLNWYGPFISESDTYDELGKVSPIIFANATIHVQDAVIIGPRANATDNVEFKKALLKYGALSMFYSSQPDEPYFNVKTAAQYINDTQEINHAVTLIGWDDNFSKDNFLITPPGDGAWIVKNSYGTSFGDNGFFYLSYYDTSFYAQEVLGGSVVGYLFNNTVKYNKNYQTDSSQFAGFAEDYTYYSNTYTALEKDLIAGVGTYFDDTGVDYELKIYVNGVLKHTQKGSSPFCGFHTVQLTEFVPVNAGDVFKVVVKSSSAPYSTNLRIPYQDGVSLVSSDGVNWIDMKTLNATVILKVYTVEDLSDVSTANLNMWYYDGSYFKATITDYEGKRAGAGEKVIFTINGVSYTVKTDSNGIAKIKIDFKPKTYTITTKYLGKTVKNTVKVKQVLTLKKVKVKKSAKKLVLSATLKSNGKYLKSKVITFKFKGKTYKAKTNKKGVAKVTIKKSVLKKLKAGKKITYTATYVKDTVKKTVKIKK